MNTSKRCYACVIKSKPQCTHGLNSEIEPKPNLQQAVKTSEPKPQIRTDEEIIALAQNAWCHNFRIMPFSTLNMVEFLLSKLGLQWKDLLCAPTILQERADEINLEGEPYERYAFNWLKRSAAGRCTAVAIQLADRLENLYGYSFEFFDMNGHRLARCKNTGLVIDSSSKAGPVVVPTDRVVTHSGPKAMTWGYKQGADGFGICETSFVNRRSARKYNTSKDTLSSEESMGICLLQLARTLPLTPLCFFRSTVHDAEKVQIRYYGMLQWSFDDDRVRLDLIPHGGAKNDPSKQIRFVWDERAKSEIRNLGIRNDYGWLIFNFINTYGGPHAARQWDQANDVFEQIWLAACKRWRYPQVEGTLSWNKVIFAKDIHLYDDTIDDSRYFEERTMLNESRRATGHTFYARPTRPGFPEYRWLPNYQPLSYEDEVLPTDAKEAVRLNLWREQMGITSGTEKCSECVKVLQINHAKRRVRNSHADIH